MNTQQGKENPQKTRKALSMKMTYIDALTIALTAVADNVEATERLTALREQLMKRGTTSDKVKEARKAKTAEARSELVKTVAPVLREVLTHTQLGLTAKEIFSEAQSRLPEGFTVAKVQNILLREMAPELEKIEEKRKANVYRLIQG